jgi:ATP-binding cassette subfamily B multidrug efflux pump
MRRLFASYPYLLRYPGLLALGLIALVIMNAAGAVIPLVVGGAIKVIEGGVQADQQGHLAQFAVDWPRLWRFTGLLILLAGVEGLFRFLMRKKIIDLSRLAERDFRQDIFRHLVGLSPSFYDRTMTGDVVTRLSSDVDAIRTVWGPATMYLVGTAIKLPLNVALMLWIDVKLTLVALLPLVIIPILVRRFTGEMHRRSRAVQDQMSTLSNMVQETLSGRRVVKVFNQEAAEERKFEAINAEYVERGLNFARIFAGFSPILHGVLATGLLVTIWFGGRQVMTGAMDYGDLSAIFLYIFDLFWPLISFGWVMSLFQRGAASMERIDEILHERSDVADNGHGAPIPARIRGRIEFRHLTFAYPGTGTPALEDIDLIISEGQTLGIVGPTGSGKSTLAALVARFYRVPDGTLLIDGVDINAIPLHHLRDAIGFVAQETFLFSDTIEDNIRLGRPDAPRGEVASATRLAQLEDQIAGFPRGYDTMLGERGINLSGGQRQRAAIARAVLLNPAILVLDDALSSVDTDTEDRILEGLRGVMAERTTLIIAHRISTVMEADEIIVLDEGRIVERGTHRSLVALGGLYADLHQRQLLEEQLERVD